MTQNDEKITMYATIDFSFILLFFIKLKYPPREQESLHHMDAHCPRRLSKRKTERMD
jgi:hypothetical protein